MTAPSPAPDIAGAAKDDRDVLLVPLLFVLTVVTGLVDSVSYLALGLFRVGVGAVLVLTLTLLSLNALAVVRVWSRSAA